MCMLNYVLFIILKLVLLIDPCHETSLRRRKMNPAAANAMVDDHCKKFEKECPRDPSWMDKGEKICGFDDVEYELAEFDEMCTLHKVDCDMHRVFRKVEMEVCDARKLFDEQFPEQASDYTKPARPTTLKNTAPGGLWTPLTPFEHKHKNRPVRWSKMDNKVTNIGRKRNATHKNSRGKSHKMTTVRHLKKSQSIIEVIYNASKKGRKGAKRHENRGGNKVSGKNPAIEVKQTGHKKINKKAVKLVAPRVNRGNKKGSSTKVDTTNIQSNKTHDPLYYTELEYYTDNETVEYYTDNETIVKKVLK